MRRSVESPRLFYRVFVVNDQGRLGGVPQIIEAESDGEAARRAESLTGRHGVELWEGARLVAHLKPFRTVLQPHEAFG